MFQQLVYISTVSPSVAPNVAHILRVSQSNNQRDGLTGLLFFNGKRFLQVLEGEKAAIQQAIARIRADDRHRAIVVLSNRSVDQREFGEWAMADATGMMRSDHFLANLERLVANSTPSIRATFAEYARMRVAA
ncbi:BLUF domain-containing protein [Sphingomonas antarctica]|uniref:BLUF domain-containing protein n=1 Tax=Sphingomonas antarctica TaxID=2040274 RepID=UPI0039E9485F